MVSHHSATLLAAVFVAFFGLIRTVPATAMDGDVICFAQRHLHLSIPLHKPRDAKNEKEEKGKKNQQKKRKSTHAAKEGADDSVLIVPASQTKSVTAEFRKIQNPLRKKSTLPVNSMLRGPPQEKEQTIFKMNQSRAAANLRKQQDFALSVAQPLSSGDKPRKGHRNRNKPTRKRPFDRSKPVDNTSLTVTKSPELVNSGIEQPVDYKVIVSESVPAAGLPTRENRNETLVSSSPFSGEYVPSPDEILAKVSLEKIQLEQKVTNLTAEKQKLLKNQQRIDKLFQKSEASKHADATEWMHKVQDLMDKEEDLRTGFNKLSEERHTLQKTIMTMQKEMQKLQKEKLEMLSVQLSYADEWKNKSEHLEMENRRLDLAGNRERRENEQLRHKLSDCSNTSEALQLMLDNVTIKWKTESEKLVRAFRKVTEEKNMYKRLDDLRNHSEKRMYETMHGLKEEARRKHRHQFRR